MAKMFCLLLLAVVCAGASPASFSAFQQPYSIFSNDPELNMTVGEMVSYHGYPFESFEVTTRDKYTLALHRIPHSRNVQTAPIKPSPVIFLQHGFDGSSADWVTNLPNQAAGYVFADAGFDVWMGNFRGNKYSSKRDQSMTEHQFWQFSWDQMASDDIPAMINFALEKSNASSLYYVGHSIGSTAGFAKFSTDRDFAQKIKKFYALGPIAMMKNAKGPLRYVAKFTGTVEWFLNLIGVDKFSPNDFVMRKMATYFCGNVVTNLVCKSALFLIGGPDSNQLNATRVPVYLSHSPGGTSTRNVIHFGQMIKSGKFQKYDHGSMAKNEEHYGQETPPLYNVTLMETPLVLFTGSKDWLADPEDVKTMIPTLRSLDHHVALDDFNHFDFIWGLRAAAQIYWPIVNDVKESFLHLSRDE